MVYDYILKNNLPTDQPESPDIKNTSTNHQVTIKLLAPDTNGRFDIEVQGMPEGDWEPIEGGQINLGVNDRSYVFRGLINKVKVIPNGQVAVNFDVRFAGWNEA